MPSVIWHHAIVTEVISTDKLRVIHLEGESKSDAEVKGEILNTNKEPGELYRFDYTDEVVKYNPPKLVLARARSRLDKNNNKEYNVFTNNCESKSKG